MSNSARDLRVRIATLLRSDVRHCTDDAELRDLVLDSFLLVETVIRLQEELGVRLMQEDLKSVKTIGDLIGVFARASARDA